MWSALSLQTKRASIKLQTQGTAGSKGYGVHNPSITPFIEKNEVFHLLKKFLIENFIFCAVFLVDFHWLS